MSNINFFQRLPKPPQLLLWTLGSSRLFLSILPSAHIVIGSVYLNECPQQPYIPIYLIVLGVFSLLLALFSCLPQPSPSQEDKDHISKPLSTFCMMWNSLTSFFMACWFIAGNVWIYPIYEPNYNKTMEPYCNKTVYLFAVGSTALVYILLALLLFYYCYIRLRSCRNGSETTTAQFELSSRKHIRENVGF